MSDYTKIVDFAAKDALITGNPAKLVKGTEIGAELDAISTAIATKYDSTDLGVTVQAYDADLATWAGVTPGTGVATALAVNVGTAGAPVVNGGALGTPSSGTVTNLTGTASININGTVGATTPASVAATTLSATGVTTVQAGTALLPAIIPSGDPNTGVWFPAADTIAVSTAGSERMRIDSSGRVGVGITPSAWGSGGGLDVGTLLGLSTSVNPSITANSYYDGTNYRAKVTGTGQLLYLNGTGGYSFYTLASVAAGASQTLSQTLSIGASGNLAVTLGTGSLGYGTGAGGTVTQATDKTTSVTLNKPTGQITMNNAALGAGAFVLFGLSNTLIASADVVIVNAGGNGNYRVEAASISYGAVDIRVTNTTGGSLSDALLINFTILKGAIS